MAPPWKVFLSPPPSFSSVVRWFHTKVILNIPHILSNLWQILRKTTRRQITTKLVKSAPDLIGKNRETARIKKGKLPTKVPSLCTQSLAGRLFMPLASLKFSDHCHFSHFSAELPVLGGKRNIWRLIHDCVWLSQRAGASLTAFVQSYLLQMSAYWHTLFIKKEGQKVCFWRWRTEPTCFMFSVAHSSLLDPTLPA